MKVLITDPAKESLKEICDRYRRLEFDSYAVKARKIILEKVKKSIRKGGRKKKCSSPLIRGTAIYWSNPTIRSVLRPSLGVLMDVGKKEDDVTNPNNMANSYKISFNHRNQLLQRH
jgi:hypothetical protein